ncbi:conserved hypothetical protein [Vibrio nigripulchritudo SO65]|uniref:helix-turn-helix domain-containing protein n=1 Tax=Vibrio nigripulchritudo TaxID=28173 RepID=UPI0003B1CDF1|nr:helix-turn-helix transcriptional regulator [Vibrio nigripulchritudo]CCN33908.1 conserved hypothetical protein [Vibrio nigripulchritudo AM115]CCN43773.1 conserved hypothetical protein [Vibrio nigripulchritudo FTn2]CCN65189.1 conserved hypothetical protein [Vibrio nigripulchritudo POn4]CCN78992.1 conserved hypothetical protein [Vibrio nigripulchritudo SO65]
MSETSKVVDELKRQLKLSGIKYIDIARELNLTEGSVKRLLASGNQISLERLNVICELMGMEMAELFKLASPTQEITALTFEQEKQLIENKGLLLVAVCVVNGYRFEEIMAQYAFSEPELIQKLAQLDKLNIIELLPQNRVKLKLSPTFSWIAGGPMQRFFQQQVQSEFFRSHFSGEDEKLVMATGLMSLPTNKKLQKRIEKLIADFYSACRDDGDLAISDRHGTSMIVALRQWSLPEFKEYERS